MTGRGMWTWILTCGGIYSQCSENSVLCHMHPSLPISCFLQPAWFLMVGGDRSFKLALTVKDEEFSDEVRGEGRDSSQ